MDQKEVIRKYRSIRDRAFKSYFDMYLVHTFLNDKNLHRTSIDHFKLFDYDKSIINQCLPVYQLTSDKDRINACCLKHQIPR